MIRERDRPGSRRSAPAQPFRTPHTSAVGTIVNGRRTGSSPRRSETTHSRDRLGVSAAVRRGAPPRAVLLAGRRRVTVRVRPPAHREAADLRRGTRRRRDRGRGLRRLRTGLVRPLPAGGGPSPRVLRAAQTLAADRSCLPMPPAMPITSAPPATAASATPARSCPGVSTTGSIPRRRHSPTRPKRSAFPPPLPRLRIRTACRAGGTARPGGPACRTTRAPRETATPARTNAKPATARRTRFFAGPEADVAQVTTPTAGTGAEPGGSPAPTRT